MLKILDIEIWIRKDQFLFFKNYHNPFFNICSNVDVTAFAKFVKNHGLSFFSASLFLSLKAANDIQQFRYRIREDGIHVAKFLDLLQDYLNEPGKILK